METMDLKAIPSISPISLIKVSLFGLLLGGLYHSAVTNMIGRWGRAEYNYCYLIPFVVLYLIYDKRAKLAELRSVTSLKGIILLGFGLGLFWLGELGGEYVTLHISSWLVVVGLCWMHLGWEKVKTMGFALLMALTMFPLPNFLYQKISIKLQLISSQFGARVLQLYGMSVHREGNVIDLGFTQLQVVDACSGLRSLMSLIVLALLMAYLFKAPFWKRVVLVISALPLSILANSIRLALTGILAETWGLKVAEGFFHSFSGWMIFAFAFAILLIEIWLLGKIPPFKSRGVAQQISSPISPPPDPLPQGEGEPMSGWALGNKTRGINWSELYQPVFVVAVVLLGATLAFSQGIDFREKIPITKAFDDFPLQVDEWTGTRRSMKRQFVRSLDLSDYVIIDYRNPTGKIVNLYVAYYESQRKGESIHSPATCLPGSGWFFREAGATTLSTPGHNPGSMKVNRAYMDKLGSKQLCYYWFPQRGRILNNAYQLKVFAFWDALTKQRTDGALVRLITPVSESENSDQADARLQGFARIIVPVLAGYVPGKEIE